MGRFAISPDNVSFWEDEDDNNDDDDVSSSQTKVDTSSTPERNQAEPKSPADKSNIAAAAAAIAESDDNDDDDEDEEEEEEHPLGFTHARLVNYGVTRFGFRAPLPSVNQLRHHYKYTDTLEDDWWGENHQSIITNHADDKDDHYDKSNRILLAKASNRDHDASLVPSSYHSSSFVARTKRHPPSAAMVRQQYPSLREFVDPNTASTKQLIAIQMNGLATNDRSYQPTDVSSSLLTSVVNDDMSELLKQSCRISDSDTSTGNNNIRQLRHVEQTIGQKLHHVLHVEGPNQRRAIHQQLRTEERELETAHQSAVAQLQSSIRMQEADVQRHAEETKRQADALAAQQQAQAEEEAKRQAAEVKRIKDEAARKEAEAKRIAAEEKKKTEERVAAEQAAKAQQAKRWEHVVKAQTIIDQLVSLRDSVEPFEKDKTDAVTKKRRLGFKKLVRGKVNTLSATDANKVVQIAQDIVTAVQQARSDDDQIKSSSGSSSSSSSHSARGKRYLVDLLCSTTIQRIQAEGFNGPRGDGFPLAALLTHVATQIPKDIVPVLMAHVFTVCPVAIPTLPDTEADTIRKSRLAKSKSGSSSSSSSTPTRAASTGKESSSSSEEELMTALGMLRDDKKNGEFESFDRWMTRTEGIISMMADIQSSLPANHILFGGSKGALDWLTRFLDLLGVGSDGDGNDPVSNKPNNDEPLPLITAPVLDGFLTNAGHMLARLYPKEFEQCVGILERTVLPRLDQGAIGASKALRLKQTLAGGFAKFQSTMPEKAIPSLYNNDGSQGGLAPVTSGATAASTTSAPLTSSTQAKDPFGTSTNPFGGGSSSSASGKPPAAPNPFGGVSNKPSPFGTSSSTSSPSPFSSSTNTTAAPAATGTGASSSIFGQSQGNTTATTTTSSTGSSSNAFGGGAATSMSPAPGSNPFGMTTSTAPTAPSLFGATTTATSAPSPFTSSNPSSSGGGGGVGGSNMDTSMHAASSHGANNPSTTTSPFGAFGTKPFGTGSSGMANTTNTFGGAASGTSTTGTTNPFGGDVKPFGSGTASNSTTPFGNAPAAPGFNSAAPSPFGATPSASPFGLKTPFGGTTTSGAPSPFGGATATNPPARPSAPTSFGAAAPSPSPFGTTAPAPIPFGGPSPAPTPFGTTPTPFGNTSSSAPAPTPFGSATSPSPFGGGGSASAPSPFGSAALAPAPTPFGNPAPAPTPFGSAAPAPTPFGNAAAAPTPFGNAAPAPSSNSTKKAQPCHFFAKGHCRNGANCKFSHEIDTGLNAKNNNNAFGGGGNPFGDSRAPTPSPFGSSFGKAGGSSGQQHQPQQGKKPCRFYAQGRCRKGANCPFAHN